MNVEKKLLEIIKIPLVSGNEKELANFLYKELKKLKYVKVWKQKINANQYNVLGYINKNSSKLLILHAHMDTVSTNASLWKHNIYGETDNLNSRIYGLGACDVKGSIATILSALENVEKDNIKNDVLICFVVNEEIDGNGTKELVKNLEKNKFLEKYKQILSIVFEPTNLNICLGNKGNAFVKIEFQGKGGHASRPEDAENPILKLNKFLDEIKSIQQDIQNKYKNEKLGVPTITPTIIETYNKSPNKIPSTCSVTLDIRTIPCFEKDMKKFLSNLEKRFNCKINYVGAPAPGSFMNEKSEYVSKIKNLIQRILNKEPKIYVKKSSTDAGFFTEKDIPCLIIGPGDEKMAHKIDEYIFIKDLRIGKVFIEKLLTLDLLGLTTQHN